MSKKQLLPQTLLLCGFLVFAPLSVQAHSCPLGEITPDNTLGAEASKLTPNVQLQGATTDLINGGQRRGNNLFHSFTQFNINDGQRVYFANPSGVVNILTRVTGGQASNIFGTLGVDGAANLFLINPSGILFGKDARLDVRGSFVGTTGDGLKFADGNFFSASNNQATPLLTVSVPIGIQMGANPGTITVQGNGHNLSYDPFTFGTVRGDVQGLQVQPGKTLALVGGDINLEGGNLRASGGRIELGSAASGLVSLTENNSNLSFGYSGVENFGNILLSQKASVDASGEGGGSIQVQSGRLSLQNGSSILSITSGAKPGGDLTVNATDSVELIGESIDKKYASAILTESQGNGSSGNLTINTKKLTATDGAYVSTFITSSGNGGNLTVKASDSMELLGEGRFSSGLYTGTSVGSSGNAGRLQVETRNFDAKNGATVFANSAGQGQGGDILIQASDKFFVSNAGINSIASGGSGNIEIKSGSLLLTDRARLATGTLGTGNAGNILIEASDAISFVNSFILSDIGTGAVGKGGDISITASSLSLTDSSQLVANIEGAQNNLPGGRGNGGNININVRGNVTFERAKPGITNGIVTTVGQGAEGNGGLITINADSFKIKDGSTIQAITGGKGNSSSININARLLSLDKKDANNTFSSIANEVNVFGEGNAGNIQIKTDTLTAANGAYIRSDTLGKGNAGNISVEATDAILLDGVQTIESNGTILYSPSGIFSQLLAGAGKGGDIQLTTGSLRVTNGAQIATNTNGNGNAGNITINARDTVTFEGFADRQIPYNSQVSSSVGPAAVGNGGDIRISGNTLLFKDGGLVQAISDGQGNAGNIFIDARNNITFDGVTSSGLPSIANTKASGNGNGGNIQLVTGSLFLTSGGEIASSMLGKGNAGNITIDARDIVIDGSNVTGANSGLTSNLLTNAEGKGGDIQITTDTLKVTNGGVINSGTSGKGQAGEIRINASDSVTLSGSSLLGFSSGLLTLTERDAFGDAGNIIVTTGKFRVADGAIAAASTFNGSKGGDITINANTFEAINGGQVITNTSGSGNAGNIRLNIKDNIQIAGNDANFAQRQARVAEAIKNPLIDRQSDVIANEGAASGIFANTTAGSSGRGGSIFIDPRFFSVRDGGKISVNSAGTGNAGDISILAGFLTLENGASITAQTASSQGGNIDLQLSDLLLLRRGSQISTTAGTAQAGGDGGNININTPFIVAVPDENSNISANAFTGRGGNVNIRAQGIFGIEPSSVPSTVSSITASSARGVQGQISITQPEVQPTQGIIELPTELVDVSNQIGQICPRGANAKRPLGEFTITGRGSLPPSPLEPLSGTTSTTKLATLDGNNTNSSKYTIHQQNTIVEAQGWVKNTDGSLELVAMAPVTTPSARSIVPNCSTGVSPVQ